MSRLAEQTVVQLLSDKGSLDYLVAEGLDLQLLPSAPLRDVVGWSIDYFATSDYRSAPSIAVLREEWGDTLDDNEVDIEEEPEATIQWAVEALKETFIYTESAKWARSLVTDISSAEHGGRLDALSTHAHHLLGVANGLEPRIYRVGAADGVGQVLRTFEDRAADQQDIRGMRMGFPVLDAYTHGIHAGELGILAAGPKTGKSFYLAFTALKEWQAGRAVILFTLENSISMTWDRIACMAKNVSYSDWQKGISTPGEIESIRAFYAEVLDSQVPFLVSQPPLGRRNFESMVGEARIHRCQSLLVDQLTFVELPDPRKSKTERIGDALHHLKALISSGREPLSCLLAHQINREGVKAADKVGHLEMYHLADSSEVERTADWVFGLYAGRDDKAVRRAKFQVLAARRAELRNWEMRWDVDLGDFQTRNEFVINS